MLNDCADTQSIAVANMVSDGFMPTYMLHPALCILAIVLKRSRHCSRPRRICYASLADSCMHALCSKANGLTVEDVVENWYEGLAQADNNNTKSLRDLRLRAAKDLAYQVCARRPWANLQ